jgi:hypothetical protein
MTLLIDGKQKKTIMYALRMADPRVADRLAGGWSVLRDVVLSGFHCTVYYQK